jgi:oligopeptide/dipeptide ABC transporter ATP-binding protein
MLSVRNLRVTFPVGGRRFAAVDGISFDVAAGEVIGIVGESGSGKSVTALSILSLIEPPGQIERGSILFEGRDLAREDEDTLRTVRGKQISMIFQEPMTSLNPVFTIGDQVGETLREHDGLTARQARARAIDLFQRVGIQGAPERVDEYPHQLSGGMRQRVMIAMALACRPKLLIADEPTTALDVTIQAQILELLDALRRETGMAIILITHDLGVVARLAERVTVMYAGQVAEQAPVHRLFAHPGHPYTRGLLGSVPRLADQGGDLSPIAGVVPSFSAMPPGCRFRPRCPIGRPPCDERPPPLIPLSPEHGAACIAHVGYRQPSPAPTEDANTYRGILL